MTGDGSMQCPVCKHLMIPVNEKCPYCGTSVQAEEPYLAEICQDPADGP